MVQKGFRGLPRRAALVLAATLGCTAAAADDLPRAVARLLNDRADAAQSGLHARGYQLVAADDWRGKTWQYWWHQRDDVCLLVTLGGGRVERLESTSETDCVPNGGDPARLSGKGRAAVDAARSLGLASLQHRSHERDERRYGDARAVAEFERGYRDGMQGLVLRDRLGRNAYADGYRTGSSRRGDPAITRPPAGVDPGIAATPIESLVGIAERRLESAMAARGFVRFAGFSKGRESFGTWYESASRRCVQSTARDGVVVAVSEANEFSCR